MDAYNEDLAIAFLLPVVAKEDFQVMAEALKSFFVQHEVFVFLRYNPHPFVMRSCALVARWKGKDF